jgi:hypothetical protein
MTRFGHITEARVAAWYGEDVWEALRICMGGLRIPVPIMGIPASITPDGRILPRVAGGMGFSSLSDLISEATTGGKTQTLCYQKAGVAAPAVGATQPLWNVGNYPAAGGVGGTSGTGAVPARTATGALKQANAAGGDTLHLTTWTGASTQAGALLLYDRLWHMTYNHATALSTAVDAANRPRHIEPGGHRLRDGPRRPGAVGHGEPRRDRLHVGARLAVALAGPQSGRSSEHRSARHAVSGRRPDPRRSRLDVGAWLTSPEHGCEPEPGRHRLDGHARDSRDPAGAQPARDHLDRGPRHARAPRHAQPARHRRVLGPREPVARRAP